MKINSITTKLLLLVAVAFIVIAVSVIWIANDQTTKIIDVNVSTAYREKVDTVWHMLARSNDKLQQTGMVDAYREDFQRDVVADVRHRYYKKANLQLYPFIIDGKGKVILHPVLQAGDNSIVNTKVGTQLLAKDNNQFIANYLGINKWYCTRKFAQWNWTVGYAVPLVLKYKAANQLHVTLFTVIVTIFVVVLVLLSLLLARIIKPITRLTVVSAQIADGNFRQEIEIQGNDEVAQLSRSFIRMQDAIEDKIQALNNEIHERELIQERLRQSEKMDAVGQLAGGVAHDFNNMLGGIMGAAELLKIPGNSKETETQYINLILDAAEKAADLTAKLSAFGRKGKVLSKAVDINTVISDTVTLVKRTIDKKIRIAEVREAVDTVVTGDQTGLQNALLNLCINASHAMPDGGDLTIISRNLNLDHDYCNASPFKIESGKYIDLEVIDTGSGIPQDQIQHIFEPFFTTKDVGKGTGLGLASVYGMIEGHNGAISVYSEVGTGTSFHLYLPCSDYKTESEARPIPENSLPHGTGCILLVDDEDIVRITGKALLEKIGYKVLTAENGRGGVEVFKQHLSEIDLVIIDMMMPEMNGSEAFYAMKEIDPDCAVFISSGFTKNEKLDDLEKNGLRGFIHKPFSINELNKLICHVRK